MYKKILCLSLIVGFIIGFFWMSDWQWTVGIAQVVSGVVSLPVTHPMRIFSVHAYAPFLIWPQVGLLKLGVSSESISILFSAIQSALCFMSVSSLLYVVSKNWIISIVTPIILTSFSDTLFSAHSYGIFFPTNLNNGGIVAFYLVVFAITSLARGQVAIFLLLLGMLPALHLGMAMGVWIGVLVYYVFAASEERKQLRQHLYWFIFGVIFFLITLFIHRLLSGSLAWNITETESRIVDYFISNVDGHRRPKLYPLSWSQRIEYFEPELMLWTAIWLFFGRYKKFISKEASIVLRFVGALSVVGFIATMLWELYHEYFFGMFKSIMYARWLNFDSIIFPLFVIGIMSYRRVWRSVIALCLLFFFGTHGVIVWRLIFIILICCIELEIHTHMFTSRLYSYLNMKTLGVISVLFCIVVFGEFLKNGLRPYMRVSPQKAKLITTLSRGKGLFASSYQALRLPQVMTTRGLVLNLYSIDTIAYTPFIADELSNTLQEMYGLSLYDKNIWPTLQIIRTTWEKRNVAEWQRLKARYNVTDILTPKFWNLNLPKSIESETLTVYHIP